MNKGVAKNIILSSIGGVLAISIGFLGFSKALPQKISDAPYVSWMSKLDDTQEIATLNIPGTHDTMARYSIANLAGQCQSLSLEDQLKIGIRFLDVRLKEEKDELKAVHGFIDQRSSFKEISDTVDRFLKKHPSEFIFMSIKEESEAVSSKLSFEEALKKYAKPNWLVEEEDVPLWVNNVRGKVILLSRYANSTIGTPAYDQWQDSCSFIMGDKDIYVQDTYQVEDIQFKKDEIIRCFEETGHNLKINFLSGYKTSSFPPSYAPSVAKEINPWIKKEISKYNNRGIVLYDFVTKEDMDAFFKGQL